ncbi:MAG: type I-B CRISPR-associated protein Cas8b1/Cst1 [Anaerolineae bacterium]|jgi:CRISPR-associated protein Cst1|nr:type I-B CRISPR-associated protein Cas8b1/Cst1 [Anaerolineae bacterium]
MIIRYIGHPFIDVGVAVLTAHAGKSRPEDVTAEDIEAFITRALDIYITPAMAGFLTFSVFSNAPFALVQDVKKPATFPRRRDLLNRYFHLWQLKPSDPILVDEIVADAGELCRFSNDPALIRVSQQFIPMIPGGNTYNFFPEAHALLPISGWCLLALLAMPMAMLTSKGKAFVVHSYDESLLLELTKKIMAKNDITFQMQGLEKMPNYKNAKTHLIEALLMVAREKPVNTSVTAYHFVAGGASPSIDIIPLQSMVIEFMVSASRRYERAWNEITFRAQRMEKSSKKEEEADADGVKQIIYDDLNYLYEDLFTLPANAPTFLRRYLLRQPPSHSKDKQDPRHDYNALKEREVISWDLIGLFLVKVMHMDKERLEAIKQFGDRLARYIQDHDARVYGKLYNSKGDYEFRRELIRIANAAKEKSAVTLIPYDEFIKVFFIEDEVGDRVTPDSGFGVHADWRLAMDLLIIRIIEQLSNDWIENNRAVLEATEKESE